MARQNYAYLGSGKIKMREVGVAGPFIAIGNASALTFGASTEAKTLMDHTNPGGGTYAKVDRITEVTVALTAHDLDGSNLARACGGAVAAVAAGTVTAESVVAYPGGTTPLLIPPSSITAVKGVGAAASTTYAPGTDYNMTPGGIEVIEGGDIPLPVDGAANITVDYANTKQQVVQAMVNSGKEYELLFEGLNEAASDSPVVVQAYRVKFTPAQAINFIGDDFAALELTGTALMNANITTPGLSKYWKATIVE